MRRHTSGIATPRVRAHARGVLTIQLRAGARLSRAPRFVEVAPRRAREAAKGFFTEPKATRAVWPPVSRFCVNGFVRVEFFRRASRALRLAEVLARDTSPAPLGKKSVFE